MKRNWIILLAGIAVSACQWPNQDKAARQAWAKCIFELDKVEAIRGRNLDDLDKGGSIARNQFMMDCLAVERTGPTMEQLDEMSRYMTEKQKREPSDMSLNNGKR